MKHDYKLQTVLEGGDERSTGKRRGSSSFGFEPGSIIIVFFFLLTQNAGIVRFGGMCERVIS